MNHDKINRIIQQSNLGLDFRLIQQTIIFIEQHLGNLTPSQEDYQIFAAAAIQSEIQTLDDVAKQNKVRTGIYIQNVMRHIGRKSKQLFLDILQKVTNKWKQAPQWLRVKIDEVKGCYRMHKKYRAVFQQLSFNQGQSMWDQQTRFNLMAIFWVLYLFVKNQHNEIDDMIKKVTLMHGMCLFAFTQVLTEHSKERVNEAFQMYFTLSQAPSAEQYALIKLQLINKMQQAYNWRYDNQILDFSQLLNNQASMQRYLDDISNLYDRYKSTLQTSNEKQVDQISFLQLSKTLTPLTIKRNIDKGTITKVIDFQNQTDQVEYDNQSIKRQYDEDTQQFGPHRLIDNLKFVYGRYGHKQPLSPFQPLQHPSPFYSRHTNLKWIYSIIAKSTDHELDTVRQLYQKYTGLNYTDYEQQIKNKIYNSISQFTPSCIDYNKRQRSIFSFGCHFLCKIAQEHDEQDNSYIFGNSTCFDSILCLLTNVINFAYHSFQGSYKQYCSIFSISLLDGHKPLNWLGVNVDMPKNILHYLYNIERRILILEIWQDDTGYQLICCKQSQFYHSQAVLKRLMLHMQERTQQLCNLMGIQQKQITRIINLVRYILDNRQILLKKHNIDQIIICCIASILSINKSKQQKSIQEIFANYNVLHLSYNTHKSQLFDCQGNQMNLTDWYKLIFLSAMQNILMNEDNLKNILETPIRLEVKKYREQNKLNTTIFNKQIEISHNFGGKKIKQEVGSQTPYRFKLVKELLNLQIQEKQEEENKEDERSSQLQKQSQPIAIKKNTITYTLGDLDGPKF